VIQNLNENMNFVPLDPTKSFSVSHLLKSKEKKWGVARRKGFEPLTPRFEVCDTLFILINPA